MSAALAFVVGSVLALAGWWQTRRVAGTRSLAPAAMLLDAAIPVTLYGLLLSASGRPIFSGAATFALAAGFAFSDRRKRAVLGEPVVVTDIFLSLDIFRHPAIAVPFPDTARVLTGAAAGVLVFVALFLMEPSAWPWTVWPVLAALAVLVAAIWALAGPLNGPAGRLLRRLEPSGDPVRDGMRFGSLATLLTYGIVARAERAQRRAKVAPSTTRSACGVSTHESGPIVLVQCESFFDVRRIHPSLPADLLPNLDECRRSGLQWGHFSVPCWGANTVRTEFAVLTGLSEAAIGLDKFNPYQGFAKAPVSSIAWRLREQGYRTVCIHPFDRRFYGRDQVLQNLGFDEFIGEESFRDAQRVGNYVADIEVARKTEELLRTGGSKIFIFIVTMENHGPWPAVHVANGSSLDVLHGIELPQTELHALRGFIRGVRHADTMLGMLTRSFNGHTAEGLLAMYGDHLPSFPRTFESLGFRDNRSDYLVWRAGAGTAVRRDINAQDLSEIILQSLETQVRVESAPHVPVRAPGVRERTQARR
jgi:hypothetical protein